MKRLVATLILVLLAGAAWQVLTADVLRAQEVVQTPRDAGPAAKDDESSDAKIRELLAKKSITRFTAHWKRRRGYLNSKECSDYNRLQGPTVYCEPSDVPDELVEEYRERQEHLGSTFLTEPLPKF